METTKPNKNLSRGNNGIPCNTLGIYFNIVQFNRVVCFIIKEQSIFLFIFLRSSSRAYVGNIHGEDERKIIGPRAILDDAKYILL